MRLGTLAVTTSKGAGEQSSRRAPGSQVDPGVCVCAARRCNHAFMFGTIDEKVDPRSPVQPGGNPARYFLMGGAAAVALALLVQYIADRPTTETTTASRANRGPSPLVGSMGGIISDDDYPALALDRNEQGTTAITLGVDRSGRVAGCTVTNSSGSELLDRTTCALARRRARFIPARDVNGDPVPAKYSTRITWRIAE